MESANAPAALRARAAGWRRLLGFAIVLGGLAVLCAQLWSGVQDNPPVRGALIGGLVAALATALGTVPVMFSQNLSERAQDTMFGFGAGVMLAACAFSLVIPGIHAARQGAKCRTARRRNGVDGRDEPDHDGWLRCSPCASAPAASPPPSHPFQNPVAFERERRPGRAHPGSRTRT